MTLQAFTKTCVALPKVIRARWSLGKDRRNIPSDKHVYRIDKLDRDFAVWMTKGDQIGLHVRATSGTKSTAMKGPNWVYAGDVDTAAIKKLVEASYQISQQRGGGSAPALFSPLARGVALAGTNVPPDLHAGGPAAKIIGQEGPAAFRIALWSAKQTKPAKTEAAAFKKSLAELDRADALYRELLPQLMQKGGRMGKANDKVGKTADALKEPKGESAPLVAARAAVIAFDCLSGGYNERAVKASGDAVEATVRALSGAAQKNYLRDLDDLILIEEMAAMMLEKKQESRAIERVLWRGADAKGTPALWLARLETGRYGLLWKLGGRWTLSTGTRDEMLATIPDAHLSGMEIAVRRDKE